MDLACPFPGLLRHAVVFELMMYRNQLRWIFRVPRSAPATSPWATRRKSRR